MKGFTFLITILLAVSLLTSFGVTCAFAAENDISPAVELLRRETKLIKTVLPGQDAVFSENDITKLYGSKVNFITVSSLPDPSKGKLLLNGAEVFSGQTISKKSLPYLRFRKAKASDSEDITLKIKAHKPGGGELLNDCVISTVKKSNLPPVAGSINLRALPGVSLTAVLPVYEPDGESMRFVITEYPRFGTFEQKDGKIKYTAKEQFGGRDRMKYYAVDEKGNASASGTVNFDVGESKKIPAFEDAGGNYLSAATEMCEKSIMVYKRKGGKYFFEPDAKVSKADFTVMLMTALGKSPADYPQADTEVFADIGNLSAGRKQYLSAAVKDGILQSSVMFEPQKPVLLSQAAEFTANALKDKSVNYYLPSLFSGKDRVLTKADCAIILQEITNAAKIISPKE